MEMKEALYRMHEYDKKQEQRTKSLMQRQESELIEKQKAFVKYTKKRDKIKSNLLTREMEE